MKMEIYLIFMGSKSERAGIVSKEKRESFAEGFGFLKF